MESTVLLLSSYVSLTKERCVIQSVLPRIRATVDSVAADRSWHNYRLRKRGMQKSLNSPWLMG